MKLAAAAAMTWLAIAIPAVAETPSPQASPSQAPAAAPSARSLELADRLIEVIRLRKQMSDAWGALGPVMMEQEIKRNPNLTADQRKVIMEAANETIAVMYDKLVERAAPLYASAFTEAEMTTLIDFYGSPVGQSLLDKTASAGGGDVGAGQGTAA